VTTLTMRVLIHPDAHSGNFGIPEIPREFMLISVSFSQHQCYRDRSATQLHCSALLVLFYQESLSQDQHCFQAYAMHGDHPQKKKRLGLRKRSNSNHNLSGESSSRTGSGSEVWNVTIQLFLTGSYVVADVPTLAFPDQIFDTIPWLVRKVTGERNQKLFCSKRSTIIEFCISDPQVQRTGSIRSERPGG